MGREEAVDDVWVNYKAIVAHSNDIFLMANEQLTVYYANPSLYRITGWTADELLKTDAAQWLHPDDVTKPRQIWEKILAASGTTMGFSLRAKHRAGHYITLEGDITNLLANELVKAIVVNLRYIPRKPNVDITRSSRLSEKRIKDTDLTNAIINSLPGIFYLYNASGQFINWNKNFEKVSGYTTEEVANMHPLDFFDADEKELLSESITKVFVTGMWDVQAHFLTKKKEKIPYYFNGRMVVIGGTSHLIGMGIDITALRKTEIAVMDVLGERNTILESIGDAFFAVDKNWTVTYWNKEAERVLSVPKQQIIGNNLWEVFSDSINSVSYQRYQEAMNAKQVIHFEDHYPVLNKWFEVSVYPSSTGLAVYFVDITERKNDIAAKAEYMQTIEQQNQNFREIAFIQSHVVRAPLSTLMGLIYVIKETELSNDELKDLLDGVMLSANKLDQIIREISEKTELVNHEIDRSKPVRS